jgi:hypothetical protein
MSGEMWVFTQGENPPEIDLMVAAGMPAVQGDPVPESALPMRMTEVEAARCALEWARPPDVLVLLVHSPAARAEVLAMLEGLSGG